MAEYGFAAIACLLFAGEIGIPVLLPAELMLFIAGNELVASTSLLLVACIAFASVDFAASLTLHMAARSGGNAFLRFILKRLSSGGKEPGNVVAHWRRHVRDRDTIMVFAMRLVPGIRISGSFIPGLLRFPLRHFVVGALPASFVWASVPLALGYEVRQHIGVFSVPSAEFIKPAALVVVLAILVSGSVWWVLHARGREHGRRPGSDWTSA